MCRSIKTLYHVDPPANDEEIRLASLQFIRKISGFTHPSKANEPAFNRAISDVARASSRLMSSLKTTAAPRDRAQMAAAARARWQASGRS